MTDTAPRTPTDGTSYRLEDRYLRTDGTVLLTGIQALARIPIDQLRRDRAAGRSTAAFCSGYPGSPLGGFDQELSRAREPWCSDLPIVHEPAVNEELGATAVMGSQLASSRPDARYDGVVGHLVRQGARSRPGRRRPPARGLRRGQPHRRARWSWSATTRPPSRRPCPRRPTPRSSTSTCRCCIPGTVGECIELGLHAVALSRATGLWSAMKIVTPIADGSGTVHPPRPAASSPSSR